MERDRGGPGRGAGEELKRTRERREVGEEITGEGGNGPLGDWRGCRGSWGRGLFDV